MCRVDPADLGHQGTVDRLPMALGAAAPSVIPRRRDAQHIAHGANLEGIALIFDKKKFHLGVSEKMRSVFFRTLHMQALILAPQTGVFSCQIRTSMRDRRLRIGAPGRSRMPPVTPVPPGAQPRRGNPQLLGNVAQRPAAARQQPHRLPPEFIRVLATRCTHQTPSCSFRSLSEVSTISREGQTSLSSPRDGFAKCG